MSLHIFVGGRHKAWAGAGDAMGSSRWIRKACARVDAVYNILTSIHTFRGLINSCATIQRIVHSGRFILDISYEATTKVFGPLRRKSLAVRYRPVYISCASIFTRNPIK